MHCPQLKLEYVDVPGKVRNCNCWCHFVFNVIIVVNVDSAFWVIVSYGCGSITDVSEVRITPMSTNFQD
jgi:hypothetical protein